jgi:hypothetical protein
MIPIVVRKAISTTYSKSAKLPPKKKKKNIAPKLRFKSKCGKIFWSFQRNLPKFPPKKGTLVLYAIQNFIFHICAKFGTPSKKGLVEREFFFSFLENKKLVFFFFLKVVNFFLNDRPQGTYMPQFVSFLKIIVVCICVKFLNKKKILVRLNKLSPNTYLSSNNFQYFPHSLTKLSCF